jgi:hypothetical protein
MDGLFVTRRIPASGECHREAEIPTWSCLPVSYVQKARAAWDRLIGDDAGGTPHNTF